MGLSRSPLEAGSLTGSSYFRHLEFSDWLANYPEKSCEDYGKGISGRHNQKTIDYPHAERTLEEIHVTWPTTWNAA
jgi:hypothetical protein